MSTTTNLPANSAETDLAIAGEQRRFTEAQAAAIKSLGPGAQQASQADLDLFFHIAKRTGLDPFARQIHLIMRAEFEGDERVQKPTIQTGIDGFRLSGRRAAARLGVKASKKRPQWAGEDGVWRDVWTSDEPPVAALVNIQVDGDDNEATVLYREFVGKKRNGQPNRMWQNMPCNQLAKCAEAAAWRMAFPQDMSGLLFEGEPVHQVIDTDGATVTSSRPGPRSGVAQLERHLEQSEPAEQPAPPADGPLLSTEQFDEIVAGLGKLFPGEGTDTSRREYVIASIGGRVVNNLRELGADEAGELLTAIRADLEREESDKGQL